MTLSLSRYMAHVVRPMTLNEQAADRISWRNVGRGHEEREPAPRDPRLCSAPNTSNGLPCCSWGSFTIAGKRYCHNHAPGGAERR